jgi:serine protease Do
MHRTLGGAAALAACLALALLLSPAASAQDATGPRVVPSESEDLALALGVEDSLVRAISEVEGLSVTVFHLKRPGGREDGPALRAGGGSGVVLVSAGRPYVLTNEHVIQGADEIQVKTSDGRVHDMRVKDRVAPYDFALLEFARPPAGLRGARIGKSAALAPGQWVIATGNPFSLADDGRPVATLGVVSGLGRSLPGEFSYADAIQHDAEVNPGSSGGPLWNLQGELVGLNGKIATRTIRAGPEQMPSNTGASFSIPIHLVEVYLASMLDDRVRASAGYTGLEIVSVTDVAGNPLGARVEKVAADSPCGRPKSPQAGLQAGDVIVRVGHRGRDRDVRSASDWRNVIAAVPAGGRVQLTYTRSGSRLSWVGELASAR